MTCPQVIDAGRRSPHTHLPTSHPKTSQQTGLKRKKGVVVKEEEMVEVVHAVMFVEVVVVVEAAVEWRWRV